MLRLLLGRLGSFVVTLLAASVIVFVVLDILPGDPAAILLGTSARARHARGARHQLGLDRPPDPAISRPGSAARFTGDLGNSITYGVPVSGLIADRLALTLPLAFMAIVDLDGARRCSSASMAAAHPRRALDRAASGASRRSASPFPDFWFGLC